jgi:prolyl oligopeptidase
MKFIYALCCSGLLLFTACQTGNQDPFPIVEVDYPTTFRDTLFADTLFGKAVPDPYRWMEAIQAPAVQEWIDQQNKITDSYLATIPFRNAIRSRLSALMNYERYGTPEQHGSYYYFFKNDGLQNQSVLYRISELEGTPETVLDPNQFSTDGTTALGGYAFSRDGNYLAYELSVGGSDWRNIRVLDLESMTLLEEEIKWVKFSNIAWEGNGFYYSRYPSPETAENTGNAYEFHQVYYHEVGTPQLEDQIIFADRVRPKRGFYTHTSEDERFLLLNVWESTSGNALLFQDRDTDMEGFVPIVEEIEKDYQFIGSDGDNLFVLTNRDAPNGRLIKINTIKPDPGYWETIIPENKEEVLEEVHLIGNKLIASFLKDAYSKVRIFDLNGSFETELEAPGIGTVANFSGSKDSEELFFSFSSFTAPATIYRLDMTNYVSTAYKRPQINFNSTKYVTKQVWYTSNDGTSIPMFLTFRADIELDGERPTLLYGYGGFNIPIKPRFQAQRAVLLENGGIFAVANIRGGGEFGEDWHQAGTKTQKQNVFNDFQAAAEYLIENNYTRKEKLAIEGRSNGGLLIGACITQRPDLYQVAFPIVGVLDMIRYQEFTIGAAWASDYGLSTNEQEFDHLISYSPYHNVTPAAYPATMVMTADRDDRVFPAHSFKFAAELQYHQTGPLPILLKVEQQAGHGAGKPTEKLIDEHTEMLSFLFYHLKEPVIYD